MKVGSIVVRLASAGALAVCLAAMSQTGGCDCSPCPDREPFESGNYEIVGLTHGNPRPEDQWLVETVVGAQLSVDREAGEATIQYSKAGTTYRVHFTLE